MAEQLDEIYNTTLAAIICRNSDAVVESQRFVMRKVSDTNRLMPCNAIDTFNFEAWRERMGTVHVQQIEKPKIYKMSEKKTNDSA